ncbi:MAG: DUF4149 domain-containing protein [Candidatus Palauibacterales bacterium]|nr:DUF4149 domain-containing protein [Candidatus Palauibacterales bacterium]
MSAYHLNVTVHLLAALFWLGGMFFLAIVGAPVLRELDDARLRGRLFAALGRRFRTAGWWAIAVLVVTGTLNLHFRGILRAEVLGDAMFWAGDYGTALAWKLGAVTAMIVVSALHDFVLGPRASAETDAGGEGGRGGGGSRKIASWLARANALLGIAVVIAAVYLARGG